MTALRRQPRSGLSFFGKMSLFRCGFTVQKKNITERPNNSDASEDLEIVEIESVSAYFPSQGSTSLGNVEYHAVESSVASLANSHSTEGSLATSAARKRGKYQHYSAETRAKIGKFSSENGNSKAINHFKEELPTLKESTVRTLRQAYEKRLREEKKKGNIDATITAIPSDTRGRPPILRDLDSKLISLLQSIRSRGGVVNLCVVKATVLALVDCNKTPYLREFEPTVTWVKSIYRRCNFTRRAGTTTRPPVPGGMFEKCKLSFLTDIYKLMTVNKIPPELVLNVDQTPCSYVSVERMAKAARNSWRQFQLKV